MSGLLRRWWGRSGVFVRKELQELRRDRKTILLAFVLPIAIYPATFSLMTTLERKQARKTEDAVFRVVVTGEAEEVRQGIRGAAGLALASGMGDRDPDEELLLERLRTGVVQIWIDAERGSADEEGAGRTLRLVYHGPSQNSREARARVRDALEDIRTAQRDERFHAAGGAGSLGSLLTVREIDVATQEEAGGAAAGKQVPFLLIITLFIGGASLSVDVVAGEKERGTLETLYLSPVDRTEIARSKFVVVCGATMLTGILSLASLVTCYRVGLIGEAGTEGGLILSSGGIALSFLMILPLAAMVGGLLLGVSAFARSLKEAQYYIMPVMLVAFLPGLLSVTQDVRLGVFTALLPVANVAIALRDSLLGGVPVHLVALVTVASVGWGALVLRWTAGVLSREDTILGFAPEPLFGKTQGGRRRTAYLGIAGTVLVFFYAGQLLQAWNLPVGLALSLWVLLPALAAVTLRFAWTGGRLTEVLSLRRTSAAPLLGAGLLGLGVVVPMMQGVLALQGLFLPAPERFLEEFNVALFEMSTPLMLLLVAFSPAVCEELVFRGAFLGILRRTGSTRAAVIASSVFFALVHLSVFRFLGTFLLGLAMAGIVVRTRSLYPAMVFHGVYNAVMVLAGQSDELPAVFDGFAGWAISVVLLAIGLALVRTASTHADDAAGAALAVPLQTDEVDPRRRP